MENSETQEKTIRKRRLKAVVKDSDSEFDEKAEKEDSDYDMDELISALQSEYGEEEPKANVNKKKKVSTQSEAPKKGKGL